MLFPLGHASLIVICFSVYFKTRNTGAKLSSAKSAGWHRAFSIYGKMQMMPSLSNKMHIAYSSHIAPMEVIIPHRMGLPILSDTKIQGVGWSSLPKKIDERTQLIPAAEDSRVLHYHRHSLDVREPSHYFEWSLWHSENGYSSVSHKSVVAQVQDRPGLVQTEHVE
jgi:hypothetical protein